MNCDMFKKMLNDSKFQPGDELTAAAWKHMHECACCEAAYKNYSGLEEALFAVHLGGDAVDLSRDFHAGFVEELRMQPPHASKGIRMRTWTGAVASVAAGTMLFFATDTRQQERPDVDDGASLVTAAGADIFEMEAPSLAAINVLPTPDRVYGDAGRELGSLGVSFYRATESAARAFLPENQS